MATPPSDLQLRYPIKNIGPQDDYLKIRIVKYQPSGLNLRGKGFSLGTIEDSLKSSDMSQILRATIILPMPQDIQDNNAADWVRGDMNPIEATLGGTAYEAILSRNIVGPFSQNIQNFTQGIYNIAGTADGQRAAAGGMVAAAIKAALGSGNLNQFLSRASGQVLNPNAEMLFNGVQIRPAFNFEFDMVPRSKAESDKIKQIITTFKVHMSPKSGNTTDAGGGLFIGAPEIFLLEYMSGGKPHPFLHRFKPCALTQIAVNYNGSAQYATYSDATPVHMKMRLQFQELTPIYQEDYNTTSGDVGVGY